MPVSAPPQPPRTLRALIEEARRRARQRRLRYAAGAAAAALLGVGALLALDGGPRHVTQPANPLPPGATQPQRLSLARRPYMGVSCTRASSIACDRVGLAIWLKRPAAHLTATISGRTVALHIPCGAPSFNHREPCDSYCQAVKRDQPCGTYFEGFLQPAGLRRDGPLKVKPDQGRHRWIGTEPPFGLVRITARYRDRHTARTQLRIPLSPGWG